MPFDLNIRVLSGYSCYEMSGKPSQDGVTHDAVHEYRFAEDSFFTVEATS